MTAGASSRRPLRNLELLGRQHPARGPQDGRGCGPRGGTCDGLLRGYWAPEDLQGGGASGRTGLTLLGCHPYLSILNGPLPFTKEKPRPPVRQSGSGAVSLGSAPHVRHGAMTGADLGGAPSSHARRREGGNVPRGRLPRSLGTAIRRPRQSEASPASHLSSLPGGEQNHSPSCLSPAEADSMGSVWLRSKLVSFWSQRARDRIRPFNRIACVFSAEALRRASRLQREAPRVS